MFLPITLTSQILLRTLALGDIWEIYFSAPDLDYYKLFIMKRLNRLSLNFELS